MFVPWDGNSTLQLQPSSPVQEENQPNCKSVRRRVTPPVGLAGFQAVFEKCLEYLKPPIWDLG